MTRFLPLCAAISGLEASVIAGIPDSAVLDSFGRWPLTVILGAVCVTCVYFMYRQSRDNAERSAAQSQEHCRVMLSVVEGEREAVKDLAETHAKELRTLLDEVVRVKKGSI